MHQNYLDQIDKDIAAKHLLKHPFYLAWTRGELSREALADYARHITSTLRRFRHISRRFTQSATINRHARNCSTI